MPRQALDVLDQALGPIGPIGLGVEAHSALRHGQQLVVAGGCGAEGCFSDVWSLEPLALRWTQRSVDPRPWKNREGHSASFVGGRMFVFGGCQAPRGGRVGWMAGGGGVLQRHLGAGNGRSVPGRVGRSDLGELRVPEVWWPGLLRRGALLPVHRVPR